MFGVVRLKGMTVIGVIGILMSFALGFVENIYIFGIPESNFYGYPLVWRSTHLLQQPQITEYNFTNLTLDISFWIVISLVIVLTLEKMRIDS